MRTSATLETLAGPASVERRSRDLHQPLPDLLLLAHIGAVCCRGVVRDRSKADRLHALPECIRPDHLGYGAMEDRDAVLGRACRRIDGVPALHVDPGVRQQLL